MTDLIETETEATSQVQTAEPTTEIINNLVNNRNNKDVIIAFDHIYGKGSSASYLDDKALDVETGAQAVIPQGHIELLLQKGDDPMYIAAFDDLHGAGQAKRILDPSDYSDDKSWVSSFITGHDKFNIVGHWKSGNRWESIKGVGRSVFDSQYLSPASGLEDFVSGTMNFADWAAESAFGPMPKFTWDENGTKWVSGDEAESLKNQGKLNAGGIDFIDDSETVGGAINQGITPFALGMYTVLGKGAMVANFWKGTVAGFVVDGAVMDPNDPNITMTLEALGVNMGAFGEFMATEPDDPEWEKRLKMATEGAMAGAVIESIFYAVRAGKAAASGDTKGASDLMALAGEKAKNVDPLIAELKENTIKDANKTLEVSNNLSDKTDADVNSLKPEVDFIDTRGQGNIYHGTSTKLENLDADYAFSGSEDNIYGSGFYTTDAVDIGVGYTKKGKGSDGTLYQITEVNPVKMFDMEEAITPEIFTILDERFGGYLDISEFKNTREVFDEFRDISEYELIPKYEVQEYFNDVRDQLESMGYGGLKHIGGLKTDKKAHEVKIYFNPTKDLKHTEVDVNSLKPEVKEETYQTPDEIAKGGRIAYRLTEDQIHNIRESHRLAEIDPVASARAARLSFNSLDTMKDMDGVLAQLAAHKNVMREDFLALKGGDTKSWKTTKLQSARMIREMADLADTDVDSFIEHLSRKIPFSELDAYIHSLSSYSKILGSELNDLSHMIDTGTVKGYSSILEAEIALKNRINVLHYLFKALETVRPNVGRAQNAMKMAASSDPRIVKIVSDAHSNSDAKALARAIVQADNPVKAALLANSWMQQFLDKFNTVRINFLLSGIGTQQVNLTGSLINSYVIPVQQIVGGITTMAVNPSKGLMLTKHGVITISRQITSAMESLKMASEAFTGDSPVLDNVTKFDYDDELTKGNKNLIWKGITLPSRVLLTADELLKQSVYRGRIAADAHLEADMLSLKGSERKDFVTKYVKESFGENGEAINRPEALLQAQRSTFTEPLEADSLSRKIQSVTQGKGLGPAAVRFMVPFIKTPINILSQSLQNMPLPIQFASRRFRDDFKSGDPIRRGQAVGKMSTGISIGSIGWYLVANGTVTGSGPQDGKKRAEWMANNQPKSIRFQNEDGSFWWFDYSRYEPLANVLGVIADTHQAVYDPYIENEQLKKDLITGMLLAFAENTFNKTFTQGLSNFFSIALGDPIKSQQAINNTFGSLFPNIINQLNGDENYRVIRDYEDVLQTRFWDYDKVDPKRNSLGEVVQRPEPKYDPLGWSTFGDKRQIDPVMAEVSRVGIQDGSALGNFNEVVSYNGKETNLKDIPYSDTQSFNDKILELSSEIKLEGKTLRETLTELIDSDDYKRETIDGKRGLNFPNSKGAVITGIISSFRKAAKASMPEYIELLTKSNAEDAEWIEERKNINAEKFELESQERFKKFNEVFSE